VIRQVVKLTLGIAGCEFVVSGFQLALANRPVIFVFAFVMVATIALVFMRLYEAPTVAKGFAVMAVFWLVILLGLGSMDALTRSWYPVLQYNPK
jgi:hypothetical protein